MIQSLILGTLILSSLGNFAPFSAHHSSAVLVEERSVLAKHDIDLAVRIPDDPEGNEIFADNILLNMHSLMGDMGDEVNWKKVREPFAFTFILEPHEVFAYHDMVLPKYKSLVVLTTNTHFAKSEGYKTYNELVGNGVCHLASLINWVASDAGLEVEAPVNHDFAPIPGVPKVYGTSVRWSPDGSLNARNQNLYIKNNLENPVSFDFKFDGRFLSLSISPRP